MATLWRDPRGFTRTASLQALVALAAFLPAVGGDALLGGRCGAHSAADAPSAAVRHDGGGAAADHAHAHHGASHRSSADVAADLPDEGAAPGGGHGDHHDACTCIGTCHGSASAVLGSAPAAPASYALSSTPPAAPALQAPRRARPDRLLPFANPPPAAVL